jgi:hypothetical protein
MSAAPEMPARATSSPVEARSTVRPARDASQASESTLEPRR